MRTIFDWYDFQQEYSDEAFIDEELALEYAADFLDVEEEPPLFDEDCYIPENEDDPDAPIALNTLREQVDETAVERIGTAARKETDFSIVVAEMDCLDQTVCAGNGITKNSVEMSHWNLEPQMAAKPFLGLWTLPSNI